MRKKTHTASKERWKKCWAENFNFFCITTVPAFECQIFGSVCVDVGNFGVLISSNGRDRTEKIKTIRCWYFDHRRRITTCISYSNYGIDFAIVYESNLCLWMFRWNVQEKAFCFGRLFVPLSDSEYTRPVRRNLCKWSVFSFFVINKYKYMIYIIALNSTALKQKYRHINYTIVQYS